MTLLQRSLPLALVWLLTACSEVETNVALGTLERDLMKDSLAIIKAFRQHLRLHYRLDFL